jgi:hypothetical protein
MNELTLTEFKIIVERAVRPVRASVSRKQKMREEILAHVSSVFEEEAARLGDDRAALERTARRFGNPADVTSQLQESVPARDALARFWEGRPGESILRGVWRFVLVEVAICLVLLGAAALVVGWTCGWSREDLLALGLSLPPWLLRMPIVLFGFASVMYWIQSALESQPLAHSSNDGLIKSFISAWKVPAVRTALIGGGLCLFLLFLLLRISAKWPTQPLRWDHWTAILAAVPSMSVFAVISISAAWVVVWAADERRRYHEQWSRLPTQPSSQS